MPSEYDSIDNLQKALSESVFSYAKDKKKAAGRALGTIIEIITFYMLKQWGFEHNISIEQSLAEYSNENISHNVEYTLHPSKLIKEIVFTQNDIPISPAKISKSIKTPDIVRKFTAPLLDRDMVLRNGCKLFTTKEGLIIANLKSRENHKYSVSIHELQHRPFAMFECKRVGVEEGTKKGPQTIEKAKQGAYVAKTVSSLQKIRLRSGEVGGVLEQPDEKIIHGNYQEIKKKLIYEEQNLLKDFILTVGVVSNHGNWFTSDNHNKELKVLAQSYDWLLFLTDHGLAKFINDLLLTPLASYQAVRTAFIASYSPQKTRNIFTKIQINIEANNVLEKYFCEKQDEIISWFNIISPKFNMEDLKNELKILTQKNWEEIRK